MDKLWSVGLALLLYSNICLVLAQSADFDTNIDRYAGVPTLQLGNNKFSVTYNKWYKVITNNALNQSYIVTFGGQQPSAEITKNSHYININNQSSIGVTGSRSVYSYLEILGLQNRVIYSANTQLVTSPCFNALTTNNATSVTFSNATDGSNSTIGFSPDDTMTPLEQASWIMYISYFFDLESMAFGYYGTNIQNQYQCRMKNMATAGTKTIAVTLYDQNQWILQQLSSQYYSTLIRDAGLEPFNGTIDNLHEADFVIDISPSDTFSNGYSSWLGLMVGHDQNTQVFTNKKNVYSIDGLTNRNGAYDWNERGPARPDLAIQDIIHVAYPTYDGNYKWTWLRNFAKGDTPRQTSNTYPSCTDLTAMFPGGCKFEPYSPDSPNNNQGSSTTTGGLSTSAKIGTIVGVIVVVVGIGCAIGFFFLKKKHQQNPEHTFYKMNDV